VGARVENARVGIVQIGSSGGSVDRAELARCDIGADARNAPFSSASTDVQDCRIGVRGTDAELVTRRCNFSHCGDAVSASLNWSTVMFFDDNVIRSCDRGLVTDATTGDVRMFLARNAFVDCGEAIVIDGVTGTAPLFSASRLTIAGNLVGLHLRVSLLQISGLSDSIVSGNQVDALNGFGSIQVTDSIVTSGSVTGPGVVAIDPEFRRAALGDYRLRRGSPAIDASSLNRYNEAVDGDLDGVAAWDYGAFEYHTLEATDQAFYGVWVESDVRPGSNVTLVVDAVPNSTVVVRYALSPSWSTLTPFGYDYVPLSVNPRIIVRAVGPGPVLSSVAQVDIQIPNDPALIGDYFLAQALVRTPAAAAGGTLTNRHFISVR